MVDIIEGSSRDIPTPTDLEGESKERLYGELLLKEARSLLERYLLEALPQEPTEVIAGVSPVYIGKFNDIHYIEREPLRISFHSVETDEQKSIKEQHDQEERAWIALLQEKYGSGEWTSDTNIDETEKQFFANRQPLPPLAPPEIKWTDAEIEALQQGYAHFSKDTWQEIYSLVHELIHQRQSELNPEAFVHPSSELDNMDPKSISRDKLKGLLREAKVGYKARDPNSLFQTVVEGMAVVGSYYVMGKLNDDLIKSGQSDAAAKVAQARRESIFLELVDTERKRRGGEVDSYDLHYVEGSRLMRKIYKRFGEQTPKLLTSVDLNACRGITKGSPQYRQITNNPTLLPGLQRAA